MILTVTPNPAWDITYTLSGLQLGATNRPDVVHQRAGGKGINVSRVLSQLGRSSRALVPLGGTCGALVAAELDAAGLSYLRCDIEGETRRTVTLLDQHAEAGQQATIVNEPGPRIGQREWQLLAQTVARALPRVAVLVLAGSLPAGAPEDGYAELIRAARAHGVTTLLDSSGAAMAEGVLAGPDVVKPNSEELRELTGCSQAEDGAYELRRRGAGAVVVSQGEQGVLAVTPQVYQQRTQHVNGNPVGAGDALVAAVAAGILDRLPWPALLARGCALAAAAVATSTAGGYDPRLFHRLLAESGHGGGAAAQSPPAQSSAGRSPAAQPHDCQEE